MEDDEDQEPDEHEEVQRARGLDAEELADALEPRDSAGDMPSPVIRASGAAMKTVMK